MICFLFMLSFPGLLTFNCSCLHSIANLFDSGGIFFSEVYYQFLIILVVLFYVMIWGSGL